MGDITSLAWPLALSGFIYPPGFQPLAVPSDQWAAPVLQSLHRGTSALPCLGLSAGARGAGSALVGLA